MTGLPVTGRLDTATRTKMVAPRCGMPDMVPEGTLPEGVQMAPSKKNRKLRPENFYVPGKNCIQHFRALHCPKSHPESNSLFVL